MFGKICPYCREKIKKTATICKHCHKELDAPSKDSSSNHTGILTGLLGIAAGALTVLLFSLYKERLRWRDLEGP